MWKTEELDNKIIHVHPLNDLAIHNLDMNCSCKPKSENIDNGYVMITHNSFDRREFFENQLKN